MKKYSGMDYLRIDMASQFGLDKELFETRIQWVHDNENNLESMEDDADDYFRYAAAVKAYRRAQKGLPTGHLVGLDACASGPQILSTIVGCEVGAGNTGAIGQARQDVYMLTTDAMNRLLDTNVVYTKAEIKQALMPFFYGSKAEPKKIFGKGTDELDAFYEAAEEVCPGASMLLPLMLDLWDPTALTYEWDLPDGFQVKYVVKDKVDTKIEVDTLDNHPTFVYRREINTTLEKAAKIPANVTHSIDGYIVRELVARCNYDPGHLRTIKHILLGRLDDPRETVDCAYLDRVWRKHGIMTLSGVDEITYENKMGYSREYCQSLLELINEVLSRPSFEVVTIHDEFKCHPNFMNWIRQTYTELLMELADSNILNVILSDVSGQVIHIKKFSTSLAKAIKDNEYSLS